MSRVLVLGATGRIGSLLVQRLLVADDLTVRVLVRDPGRLPQSVAGRVEVVTGDLLVPGSLAQAVEGVDVVACAVSGDVLTMARNLVTGLTGSSVRQVLWVTGLGIHHEVPGPTGEMLDRLVESMPEYVQAADAVAAGGVPATLVRAAHLTDGDDAAYHLQREGEPLHANNVDRVAVAAFMADAITGACDPHLGDSVGVTG